MSSDDDEEQTDSGALVDAADLHSVLAAHRRAYEAGWITETELHRRTHEAFARWGQRDAIEDKDGDW